MSSNGVKEYSESSANLAENLQKIVFSFSYVELNHTEIEDFFHDGAEIYDACARNSHFSFSSVYLSGCCVFGFRVLLGLFYSFFV